LRSPFYPLLLIVASCYLFGQSSPSIADHILWERDFPNLGVSVNGAAVADHNGNLWAVSEFRGSRRLLCISPMGEMLSNTELPQELNPALPAEISDFKLAASPSGVVALLARYMHGGHVIYFDGAKFASVNSDGSLGPIRKVADGGPEYKELVGVSNDNFLVIGDQSPMVVIRIRSDGDIAWRRTFPSTWVLPSGAALEDGSSCIVSPDYGKAILHLVWLDRLGVVRHREQIAARRSHAAGSSGSCTVLYDREPALTHGEFHITSFDQHFSRVWTTPVLDSAPQGGVYDMAAVSDGYVVTIGLKDGLFLAKYALTGRMLWVARDTSRLHANLLVGAGDTFI
jgi:hypothetical protein